MKKKEIILSDLAAAVQEKDRLSDFCTADRWETVSYETAAASGRLLIASEQTFPDPVTIDPKLTGRYRIYVCMANHGGGWAANHIHLKLTDDEFTRVASPGNVSSYIQWSATEVVEESLWKCADMTGQKIEISKIQDGLPHTSNVLWFRFVPIESDDSTAPPERKPSRTMLAHMDTDFHCLDVPKSIHDYCNALNVLKDSDVGILCQEVMTDLARYKVPGPEYVYRQKRGEYRENYHRHVSENREKIYPEEIAYAHKCGIKLFAAHRMQLSCFSFPTSAPLYDISFVYEHPELRCRARDGQYTEFLSYGYQEIRDFMIGNILESARQGFDGVELIWTRGQHLLFEEPVLERFRAKFGDTPDCRRLPADDPRLMEAKSDIMTDFFRQLRTALDGYAAEHGTTPLKIYAAVYFDLESSKKDSLDAERLAAEGLIDGIIQSKMKVWEETADVLADDGLIDLSKYTEKAKTKYVYNRIFGNRIDLIVSGIPAYRAIADQYGIDFYSEVQWEGQAPPEGFVNAAKQIYAAGGKGIALWDCAPCRMVPLAEWNATSHLGDPQTVMEMSDQTEAYHTIHKVLSYGGRDMRYIHPGWRG